MTDRDLDDAPGTIPVTVMVDGNLSREQVVLFLELFTKKITEAGGECALKGNREFD